MKFRVMYLGDGARPKQIGDPMSERAAGFVFRRLKRQGRTAWLETEKGRFHPVKGATRKPAHLAPAQSKSPTASMTKRQQALLERIVASGATKADPMVLERLPPGSRALYNLDYVDFVSRWGWPRKIWPTEQGRAAVKVKNPVQNPDALELQVIKSKHGPTYKVEISGEVNRIKVKGYTRPIHVGLDELTRVLVRQKLVLNRDDGSGKKVPAATRFKVEDAVLESLTRLENPKELENPVKYRTKKGKHGTLYLHEIEYKDPDPAAPIFRTKTWAYNKEHAFEKFYDDPDEDWIVLRIARVMEGRIRSRWAWTKGNPAAAVQSRPDRGAPIALRNNRALWEKVHGSARRIYNGDLAKFARRAADKVVADAPRMKSWGQKARMPNPGTTVLLGQLIELHVLGSDGNIVMYVPKKPPPLLWSPGVRRDESDGSLFAFAGMRVPNPEAACRASEAANLYKAWNAGEKEPRGMSHTKVSRPEMSGAVPAIAVVYRSDKFTEKPIEYIHHFEEGVRARTDGKVFYVTGGRLTLTERGLEK